MYILYTTIVLVVVILVVVVLVAIVTILLLLLNILIIIIFIIELVVVLLVTNQRKNLSLSSSNRGTTLYKRFNDLKLIKLFLVAVSINIITLQNNVFKNGIHLDLR